MSQQGRRPCPSTARLSSGRLLLSGNCQSSDSVWTGLALRPSMRCAETVCAASHQVGCHAENPHQHAIRNPPSGQLGAVGPGPLGNPCLPRSAASSDSEAGHVQGPGHKPDLTVPSALCVLLIVPIEGPTQRTESQQTIVKSGLQSSKRQDKHKHCVLEPPSSVFLSHPGFHSTTPRLASLAP